MSVLNIYVPRPDSAAERTVARGSALVGRHDSVRRVAVDGHEDVMQEVHYEGNVYGAENLRSFEERVAVAAGRLVANYPTVARGWFSDRDLILVGAYNPEQDEVDIHAAEDLARWLESGR